MNEELNITLIQSDLVWENSVANRKSFETKIKSIATHTDLIILPEMFTTGFTMNAKAVAETMQGDTVQWMQQIARFTQAAICGSIVIEENNSFVNRFLFITPEGTIEYYDKHQLFTLAKEQEVFTAGQREVIIDYKGWKIKPLICYDLRFPVWSRNTSDYDILVYVASWPKLRINAWDALLKARAIENMCYCIGVNRVGLDGKGFEYNGHTSVYNALGDFMLEENPTEKEAMLQFNISKSHIEQTRTKLPFLNDRDKFTIH